MPLVGLGDVRWTGRQFCAAVGGGLWITDCQGNRPVFDEANDVKVFWNESEMGRLSDALDGNPLMLAEAAHWLTRMHPKSNKRYRRSNSSSPSMRPRRSGAMAVVCPASHEGLSVKHFRCGTVD